MRGELDEARAGAESAGDRKAARSASYAVPDAGWRAAADSRDGEEFTLRREEPRGPLQERLEAEARRPFDLGEEIPVRALLLRVGAQEWVLSLDAASHRGGRVVDGECW